MEAVTSSSVKKNFLATTIERDNVYYPGFVPFLQSETGKQQLQQLSVKQAISLWAFIWKSDCPWTTDERIIIIERLIEVIPESLGYRSHKYGGTVLMHILGWEGVSNLPSKLLKDIILADQKSAILRGKQHERNVLLGWMSCLDRPLAVLQHLNELYPESITHPDGRGNLPLHRAVSRVCSIVSQHFLLLRHDSIDKISNKVTTAFRSANYLLDSYPHAATVKNDEGKLPFHLIFDQRICQLDSPVCFHKEMLALTEKLRTIYPCSAQMKWGELDRLPLHFACSSIGNGNSCFGRLLYSLDIYPQSIFEADSNGDTPLVLIRSMDAVKVLMKCISSCDKVKRQICQLRDTRNGNNILHHVTTLIFNLDKEKMKAKYLSKDRALKFLQHQNEVRKHLPIAFSKVLPCLTMETNHFRQLPLHRYIMSCEQNNDEIHNLGMKKDDLLFFETVTTFVQCMDEARNETYHDDPLAKMDQHTGLYPFMMAATTKNPCVSSIFILILRFVSVTGEINTTSHNEHVHEQQQQKQL